MNRDGLEPVRRRARSLHPMSGSPLQQTARAWVTPTLAGLDQRLLEQAIVGPSSAAAFDAIGAAASS